jgi:hypothetical protein
MKKTLLVTCILIALAALPASAATYYVGTCHAGSFLTISAAVNSPNVPAGSTIRVCGGEYREQVIISKSLTLQGYPANGVGAATIRGYATDSIVFTPFSGSTPLRPSIWITAGTVNITGMSIMETYSDTDCGSYITGIYYASGTSGVVKDSNVSILSATSAGCAMSEGISAENAISTRDTVKVQNSTFEVESVGVLGASGSPRGLSVIATGNQVYTARGGYWAYGSGGTVSGNLFALSSQGNAVYGKQNQKLSVTRNTINADIGVDVQSPATVTNNLVRAELGVEMGCTMFTVTGNTFTGGFLAIPGFGLDHVPAAFTGKNTFYNVFATNSTC